MLLHILIPLTEGEVSSGGSSGGTDVVREHPGVLSAVWKPLSGTKTEP